MPGDRWCVDETYAKVAGRWVYLYRAIERYGQVIDVLVSEEPAGARPSVACSVRRAGLLSGSAVSYAPDTAQYYAKLKVSMAADLHQPTG